MMSPDLFLATARQRVPHRGGQELILLEVLTLLMPFPAVWLPFPGGCRSLELELTRRGRVVLTDSPLTWGTALYFGTPTIVDGKPLFPEVAFGIKTKEEERMVVRKLVARAQASGVDRIVSGLGSGDISPEERIEDLGPGARVVVYKEFEGFTDWVIARNL